MARHANVTPALIPDSSLDAGRGSSQQNEGRELEQLYRSRSSPGVHDHVHFSGRATSASETCMMLGLNLQRRRIFSASRAP